jgi:fructokinase
MNFACHCQQLGVKAYPVSSVGQDDLGREARDAMIALGLDVSRVTENGDHPTGTVQVTLDDGGKPTYEICEGVAWDMISLSPELVSSGPAVAAVCFGSLAQRHHVSRAAIHELLAAMRPDALKIFDVNLRQSFFSRETLEASLEHANILKLSDEELPVLADMFDVAGGVPGQLNGLRERFNLQLVAYTRGPAGSLLLTADAADDCAGHPAEVVDTVGAGDSFTAALCVGLLAGAPLAAINDHANRVAAYVCSQPGATPRLPAALKRA